MSISKHLQCILNVFFFFCFRFKNLHFEDPVNCQKAIGKIKRLLIVVQNEHSVEIEPTTSSEMTPLNKQSFDLWSYHKTVASLQIQNRTMPVDQEVKLYQCYNFSEF